MVTSLYTNKDENYIDFEYTTSDYKFNLDNEHHVTESITIHGNPAHFLRAIVPGYASTLTWYDESNHTAFSLSADLPADNLIKIAESVEKN